MLQGYNLAYEAGVDIISVSSAGPGGWSEGIYSETRRSIRLETNVRLDPLSVLVQRLSEKGVMVVTSASNNGSMGLFGDESPGALSGAIAVASMDNHVLPLLWYNATYTTNGANLTGFGYIDAPQQNITFERTTFPMYALDYSKTVTDTACKPLPDSTPDLGEYVVLVRASHH